MEFVPALFIQEVLALVKWPESAPLLLTLWGKVARREAAKKDATLIIDMYRDKKDYFSLRPHNTKETAPDDLCSWASYAIVRIRICSEIRRSFSSKRVPVTSESIDFLQNCLRNNFRPITVDVQNGIPEDRPYLAALLSRISWISELLTRTGNTKLFFKLGLRAIKMTTLEVFYHVSEVEVDHELLDTFVDFIKSKNFRSLCIIIGETNPVPYRSIVEQVAKTLGDKTPKEIGITVDYETWLQLNQKTRFSYNSWAPPRSFSVDLKSFSSHTFMKNHCRAVGRL
ncbi:hypothetical protein QR680_004518 [Steinernema hermaphroditum]|uniref:Uncharacterized protein n=1 Tax=Steinernema hermaphroditum TaxID=289476 RepID=A0AA39LTT3_9BILA|nr:hypothetical protein QR680_004518 [Steinernema hermaphroditum]